MMSLKGYQTRLFATLLLSLLMTGCSSVPQIQENETPPRRTLASVEVEGEATIDQYDPLEGFNRGVYRFNAWFDKYVFLPAAGAYKYVTPDFVETGVHNFMQNVGDLGNLINSALQLKGKQSLVTAGRLITNTTIGVLGLWDPATKFGMERHEEDFGQTLGYYGVGPGPYLVLPIFGPSSLRDGAGLAVDGYAFTEIDPLLFDKNNDSWEYTYYALLGLDTRTHTGFRYYQTGSPFEYELVRLLYLKEREIRIAR